MNGRNRRAIVREACLRCLPGRESAGGASTRRACRSCEISRPAPRICKFESAKLVRGSKY
jgi:hypothetical protein